MKVDFDSQAQDWDDDPMKIERAKAFAKEIHDFIQPNQKLSALEFGCGTGMLSFQLKDSFESITLADSSEGMIQVLNEKIKKEGIANFTAIKIDLLTEQLEAGDFDVIYTLMTLHHIPRLDDILPIFNSLLKSGGYLCIADLVQEDGSFHSQYDDFDGHNGFDKDELSAVLSDYGFTTEYYSLCFEIEKTEDGKNKTYPLFLMICKKE